MGSQGPGHKSNSLVKAAEVRLTIKTDIDGLEFRGQTLE